MKPAAIDAFFERLSAANPAPETELNYTTPYTLIVAVVLSAQATDAGVNRATANLFKAADTPEKMLKLGEASLKKHIKTIGLFNAKAKNIMALSEKLLRDFGGQVPHTHADLESLPGVGRKTANVVMNVLYDEPTMAVDTHVFRVANRTGMAKGKTPRAVEDGLLKVIPKRWMKHAHHWLILHGRYVCKARAPQCPTCVVSDLCGFKDKVKA
ncbi:MAG: endonuclease III [Alphaproteobacteria bacterium]|nr:endonuclease III [Alphaproteobacteria bacterium]MBV8548240.1 endonuclease III [Alphaproteobacteria bacterium]